ncbi:MAG: NAD-binding protein, partial [Pseudomonadota bacterium]
AIALPHTAGQKKAGIPRHVFLQRINDSVLGSMYTRYKSPMLTNLTFDQVTFTPKLLLKDMDLGLGAAKAYGVPMPSAAATRESVARMVGRGHGDIDFAVLLQETAADAGLVLKSENVKVSDGLES